MIRFLSRLLPPACKLALARWGARALLRSLLRLTAAAAAAVGAAGAAALLADSAHLPWALLPALAIILAAAPPARCFDVAGRLLVARGNVLDNGSLTRRARRHYAAALLLLADSTEALFGIMNDSRGARRIRAARRLARAARRTRDQKMALAVMEELVRAGDVDAALAYCRALPISAAPELALCEAHCLLDRGMARAALERLARIPGDSCAGLIRAARARALSELGRHAEAFREMEMAVAVRGYDAEVHREKAMLLARAGRDAEALKALDRSLFLHRVNPKALGLRASLCLRLGKPAAAHRALRRALFCDNTDITAFLRLRSLRRRGRDRLPLPETPDEMIRVSLIPSRAAAVVGETVDITVRVESRREIVGCLLTALEPYGGGLEVQRRTVHASRIDAGMPFETTLSVTGKRASAVNFDSPWRLCVVMTCRDGWAAAEASIDLLDDREGEVHLVISNDHETAIRRERMTGGGTGYLTPEEARADLVSKMRRAHTLSEPFGFRWTHLLDAGTAIGLVRWAGLGSRPWAELEKELLEMYREARARSHDLQLHLHLSAVPQSWFFCYRLDPLTHRLEFDREKKDSFFPGWQVNSWARVARPFGPSSSPDSRLGSIRAARAALAEALPAPGGSLPPVLFRAGQWDFGASPADRDVSFIALRESGVLADSSASSGSPLQPRSFSFGAPPRESCYFTRLSDVHARARTLLECGMTEVQPILMPQGRHAVTPRSSPRPVIRAYRVFAPGGRVLPGRHIIMEIEHLGTMPDPDAPGPQGKEWDDMKRHFQQIARRCPQLRGSAAADALASWWDYYSPELIALPVESGSGSSCAESSAAASYSLRFLASSILCRTTRFVPVVILVPPVPGGRAVIRIMKGKSCIWRGRLAGKARVTATLPLSAGARDACWMEVMPEACEATGAKSA